VGEAGRNLLAVMGDQNDRRAARVGGHRGEADQEALPGTEIEPSEGFVEQEQFRVTHQRPGQEHLLAFAFRNHPEWTIAELGHPAESQKPVGLLPVFVGVPVPPRLERPVAAADDDVSRRKLGPELPGNGAADESNSRAEGPDINLSETGSEDFHRAGRWPQPGAGDLQQCGLAGPVRPEDDPPVSGADAPVDAP